MGQLLFGSAGIEFQFYIRLGYKPESYDHWFAGAGVPGRGVRRRAPAPAASGRRLIRPHSRPRARPCPGPVKMPGLPRHGQALPRGRFPRILCSLFSKSSLRSRNTGISRVAPCCNPTTWKSAPAPRTPPPSCAPSVRSPGAPPMQPSRRPRRPLRREPQPPAALLPIPGGAQARAPGNPGPVHRLAEGAGHRPGRARHPLRRGRLGKSHTRRLGPGKSGSTAWK